MRTLKKTLCLVLCLAMMVGLCAIGASATDFTDDADIENKEEVDLLVGLGIIEGYEDGSFNPTKILTRAEASKIIAYLLLGKAGADALAKADTIFPDVTAAHWASGFIAYCASQGIVEGYEDGTFRPSEPLTAAAWGKMLLCALGYDQNVEGMTGSSWDFNVTRLVTRTKLASAFDGSAEMSRDAACLLAYNALTVPMVMYENGVTVTTGDGTTVDVNAAKVYRGYLADKYSLAVGAAGQYEDQLDGFAGNATKTGVIIENDGNIAPAPGTTTILPYAYNEDGEFVAGVAAVLKTATDADMLGHYVKFYTNRAGAVVSMTDLGSTTDVAKATTAKTFKSTFGTTAAKFAAAQLEEVMYFIDGWYWTEDEVAEFFAEDYEIDYANGIAPAGTYIFSDTGKLAAVILSDGDIFLSRVTKVDEKNEQITLAGNIVLSYGEDDTEVTFYDGIAKGDIVLVTLVGGNFSLAKAETVNGAVTKVTPAAGGKNTVTIGGKDYTQSYYPNDTAYLVNAVPDGASIKAGATYTLYLDGDGSYIVCVADQAKVAVDALYVVYSYEKNVARDRGGNSVYKYVTVVNDAGEISEVLISVDNVPAQDAPANGTFITAVNFTSATAGDTATATAYNKAGIKKIAALNEGVAEADQTVWGAATAFTFTNGVYKLTTSAKSIATADGSAYVNADTVYAFVKNFGQASVSAEAKVGGVNFNAEEDATVLYKKDASGNKIVKTVFFNAAFADAGRTAKDLIYFAAGSKPTTSADGYTYTVYNVATGEKTTITSAENAGTLYGFRSYTLKSDGSAEIAADYLTEDDVEFYDIPFKGIYGNGFQIEGYTDVDISNVKIIDLRSAAAKAATITIDDMDDIVAAKSDYDFIFDLFVDKSTGGRIATVLFIRSVTEK